MPRRRQTNTRPAPPNGNPNGGGSSGHHHNQNENHHHHHHSHHHRPRHHQHHHNNNNYNNGNNNYQQQQNNAFPQQQQHEYYQQSDHDAVAASAVLAYRNDTRSSLNLPVIRRHIPTAIRVVAMAAYVTVYKISATSGQWDKPDIEGPLFILEVDIDPNDNENEDEGNGNGDGDGDGGGGGGDESSSNGNGNGRRKWKKLTTRYQIFVMNRKGICSLLIPLPRKAENLDTGNSELISILVDEASTTSKNKRNSMENDGGTGDNHKRSTSKNRNSSGGGDGKMKFNESDEKGKSVECYGLRIYSEEGTSTEGDRQRIGEELIALVAELKEEELLAARLAEEAKAEMERQRIMEEEMAAAAAAQQMAMMEMQQQPQQQQQHHHHHHHHHAAAVGMARSQSTFRDMGGSYRENMSSGRRITLAELFGQNSAGIGGGGGLDPMSGFRDGEYEEVPGPVPMGFSYTHM